MQHLTIHGFPKWIWVERKRHTFLRMKFDAKSNGLTSWASKAQYVSDDGFVVTATLADAYRLSCDGWRIC